MAMNLVGAEMPFTDYGSDLEDLKRRQAYADLLRQQSLQPVQSAGMAGRTVAPISWAQGLAQMLKASSAGLGDTQVAQERKALGQRYSQERKATIEEALAKAQGRPMKAREDASGNVTVDQEAIPPDTLGAASRLATSSIPDLQAAGTGALVSNMIPKPVSADVIYRQAMENQRHSIPSGSALAGQAGAQQRHETPSADAQARLTQAERHWNELSPYQKEQIKMEDARLGVSEQHLMLQRITADPFGLFGVNPGAGGGQRQQQPMPHGTSPNVPPVTINSPEPYNENGPPAAAMDQYMKQAHGAGIRYEPQQQQQPHSSLANLQGEELLKTLQERNPALAAEIKQRAEGLRQPPGAFALKSPYFQQLMPLVQQYDPTYTDARYQTRNEFFSKGKTADNVVNINQAISHMGTLSELHAAMKNGNIQLANNIANNIAKQLGKPELQNAQLAQQAVGNELMRVFRGVGASQQETKDFEDKFNAAKQSPEQMAGALQTGTKLLEGRLKALENRYVQAMNNERFRTSFLSPEAKTAFEKLKAGTGGGPKEGDEMTSNSGRPIVYRGGQWIYK